MTAGPGSRAVADDPEQEGCPTNAEEREMLNSAARRMVREGWTHHPIGLVRGNSAHVPCGCPVFLETATYPTYARAIVVHDEACADHSEPESMATADLLAGPGSRDTGTAEQ